MTELSNFFDAEDDDESVWLTARGWRSFVEAGTQIRPKLVPPSRLQRLSSAKAEAYRIERLRYLRDAVINSDGIREAIRLLNTVRPLGEHLLLTGYAREGKTTTLKHLGRKLERHYRRLWDAKRVEHWGVYYPVIPITIPSSATITGFDMRILDFLGVPYSKNDRLEDFERRVVDACRRLRVRAILADEIHFLYLGKQASIKVNNHIKDLQDQLPAVTFVFAGIDVQSRMLLADAGAARATTNGADVEPPDPRFSQTGRRLHVLQLEPFERSGPRRSSWLAALNALSKAMVLHGHRDGALQQFEQLLYERSAGAIGPLKSMLVQALDAAIQSTSRITQAVLEATDLTVCQETIERRRADAASKKRKNAA